MIDTQCAAAAALLSVSLLTGHALAGGGPAETVVLANRASEASQSVADHFAEQRDLPPSNVLA
ncbi:MAG: hypothetical protein ACPG8W_21315, partial [Candidatus Promineifilaceae bacterium]